MRDVRENGWNRRKTALCLMLVSAILLCFITVAGMVLSEQAGITDFTRKNLPPGATCFFGTDWMGRDMFARTIVALSRSIRLGFLTSCISTLLAFILGILSASGGKLLDGVVNGIIDLVMGIPHILLLILISFALGKGFWGVTAGIALTHWTSLARLIRGEVLQLKEAQYVKIAGKLGVGEFRIALRHMTPFLFPQLMTGLVLLFPHVILHEASITFLGFGLSSEEPAIGVILSESMRYLAMGKWWLSLLPGLLLVLAVLLFRYIGSTIGSLMDPGHVHQ